MITGLTPVATEQTSATPNIAGNQSLGKEDFLQLLVAQLQAQDPLDPQSAEDFSAQLAQFSALEQMTNVNTNLEEIQKFSQAVNNSSLINLIGKNIDSQGSSIDFQSGEVQTLKFSLDEDAAQVEVDVLDSAGNKVTSLTLNDLLAGSNQTAWNGTDAEGKTVPPGAYTFAVKAFKANGEEIESKTFVSGTITDVIFENDESFALVDGEKIPVSEISRVGT
jgi:flagellar basal-body rod modification protein FlgD